MNDILAMTVNDGVPATESKRFKFQLKMLEKGGEELERQIGRLDDVLFKIKASAITVWVAVIGWAISSSTPLLVPLGFAVLAGFWLLEGIFRRVQLRYIGHIRTLATFLNDTPQLERC